MPRGLLLLFCFALAACDDAMPAADPALSNAAAKLRALGYNCRDGLDFRRTAEHADGSKTYRFTCAGGVAYRIVITPDGQQRVAPWE